MLQAEPEVKLPSLQLDLLSTGSSPLRDRLSAWAVEGLNFHPFCTFEKGRCVSLGGSRCSGLLGCEMGIVLRVYLPGVVAMGIKSTLERALYPGDAIQS